jgi:hypothetical protein
MYSMLSTSRKFDSEPEGEEGCDVTNEGWEDVDEASEREERDEVGDGEVYSSMKFEMGELGWRVISLVSALFRFCAAMRVERRVGMPGVERSAASRALGVGFVMRIDLRKVVIFEEV